MIHVKKVEPPPAPPPPPPPSLITVTMDMEFAKKLNNQLGDLQDRYLDPTRELFLTLNPVVRGEYGEMQR
jgi:hypothetical protein